MSYCIFKLQIISYRNNGFGCLIRHTHLTSHQPTTTPSSISQLFAGKMRPQPAGGRKCFPRVHEILKHGFLHYSNKQTYFSSEKKKERMDLGLDMGCMNAQSCLIFCNPMDCSTPGIFQARIMEWVAISLSVDMGN